MKKGEVKRQAILDTAYRLFRDQGFDKTSMSEITAQVGGSKATLYNHFTSKEQLFAECMTAAIDQYFAAPLASLDMKHGDMGTALRQFGESFLLFMCSSEMVAVRRLMIAEASRLGGTQLFLDKIRALRDYVANYLADYMESGQLRKQDPVVAANHLRGLLESEVLEPLMLNAIGCLQGGEDQRGAAQRAVDVFLRGYAT